MLTFGSVISLSEVNSVLRLHDMLLKCTNSIILFSVTLTHYCVKVMVNNITELVMYACTILHLHLTSLKQFVSHVVVQ